MITGDLHQISTVLFDFDGVIADTEQGRYEAYCDILAGYGYDMCSRCTMLDLAGLTGDGFMSKFFPEIPREQVREIVHKRQNHYMANLDRFCIPYPGMRQTVADLKACGYFLALTTANATVVAEQLLEVVGVREYFDAVCGREICENPETKVKDYRLVPEQINKKTEACVVIEDSPVGVAGAKRSGFYCIAFDHLNDPAIAAQADVVVHDYNDLRQLFGLPCLNPIG